MRQCILDSGRAVYSKSETTDDRDRYRETRESRDQTTKRKR